MTTKREKSALRIATTPVFLSLVFTVLKLTKQIDWKWIWIISPVWIALAVVFILLIIIFLAMLSRD